MSSVYYKENSDPLIREKVNESPDMGVPLERNSNSVKEKVGFLGFVLIIIILLVFMGEISNFFEKGPQIENSVEKRNTAPVLDKRLMNDSPLICEKTKPNEQPFETIETYDLGLMALDNEKKHNDASRKVALLRKNNKLDDKNVEDIKKKREIAELEKKAISIPVSRVSDNLNIYKQLLAVEPDNPKYKKKVDFYKAKLEENKEKKEKEAQFVMIDKEGSAPVLSFPVKGSILGSISSGKTVQILEKQSIENGMMAQIWYRVKINGSYGWISKDVTTDAIIGENVTTVRRR
jgi:hypothetical protein